MDPIPIRRKTDDLSVWTCRSVGHLLLVGCGIVYERHMSLLGLAGHLHPFYGAMDWLLV